MDQVETPNLNRREALKTILTITTAGIGAGLIGRHYVPRNETQRTSSEYEQIEFLAKNGLQSLVGTYESALNNYKTFRVRPTLEFTKNVILLAQKPGVTPNF
jgi:hypothetical protein